MVLEIHMKLCVRAVLDIGQKGHFFWKRGPQKFHPTSPRPYSIPFLSILHQNKALHSFCKRGQRSIVECSIGLEYARIGSVYPSLLPSVWVFSWNWIIWFFWILVWCWKPLWSCAWQPHFLEKLFLPQKLWKWVKSSFFLI